MTATPEPPDYDDEVFLLLQHAVRDEVVTANAIGPLGLSDQDIDNLTVFIVDRISTAFELKWRPSWLPQGVPHTWTEEGAVYARCTDCLLMSPAAATAEAAAGWFGRHRAQAHPAVP
jgi:hypothetical protein